MDWNTLTVQQYQDIYNLKEPDEFTKSVKIVCILYGKTEAEVEDMDLQEFNKLAAKSLSVLNVSEIPGKRKNYIKVNGNRYYVNYLPNTLKMRQYVELQSYVNNPIQNMHLVLASIVQPMHGWFRRPNNVDDHERYSTDMMQAKIVDIYHSCVFFCKLYRDLITGGRNFLEKSMTQQGMSQQTSEETVDSLIDIMDGFIPQNKLQTTKI